MARGRAVIRASSESLRTRQRLGEIRRLAEGVEKDPESGRASFALGMGVHHPSLASAILRRRLQATRPLDPRTKPPR